MIRQPVHSRTLSVIGNNKLFNIVTTMLLVTINIASLMLKALVSDHPSGGR